METNISRCDKCMEEMVWHVPSLDVVAPLNRGDMALIIKVLMGAYCGLNFHYDESEHKWAHRLIREFNELNPTDHPFAANIQAAEDPLGEFLGLLAQAGVDIKFVNLDEDGNLK